MFKYDMIVAEIVSSSQVKEFDRERQGSYDLR